MFFKKKDIFPAFKPENNKDYWEELEELEDIIYWVHREYKMLFKQFLPPDDPDIIPDYEPPKPKKRRKFKVKIRPSKKKDKK